MYEEKITQNPKKKINLWLIGLLVLVLAVCIVIWEGGQYHYSEWKREIYISGYNQSRIDTIFQIAWEQSNTGNIIYLRNGTIASRNINEICEG